MSGAEIEYEVLEDDLVAFSEYHADTSPVVRRRRWSFVLIPVAAALVAALVSYRLTADPRRFWFLAVLAVLWVPYASWRFRWNTRRYALRLYREGRNRSILGRHRLEIAPDGLISESEVDRSFIQWAGIERIASTPDHTFIYVTATASIAVPRGRVTRGDYESFMERLKTRLRDSTGGARSQAGERPPTRERLCGP